MSAEQKRDLQKDLVFARELLELVQVRRREAEDNVVMRRKRRQAQKTSTRNPSVVEGCWNHRRS